MRRLAALFAAFCAVIPARAQLIPTAGVYPQHINKQKTPWYFKGVTLGNGWLLLRDPEDNMPGTISFNGEYFDFDAPVYVNGNPVGIGIEGGAGLAASNTFTGNSNVFQAQNGATSLVARQGATQGTNAIFQVQDGSNNPLATVTKEGLLTALGLAVTGNTQFTGNSVLFQATTNATSVVAREGGTQSTNPIFAVQNSANGPLLEVRADGVTLATGKLNATQGYLYNGSGGVAGQALISDGTAFKAADIPAAGGALPLTTFDAAGDLVVGTGADAAGRLAKGNALDVLRVNTDGTALEWAAPAGGGAPTDATYITQTANGSLSNEQALSGLTTGLVKVTTGTGVLSTAGAGTDYIGPSSTGQTITAGLDTGSILSITGNAWNGTANTYSALSLGNNNASNNQQALRAESYSGRAGYFYRTSGSGEAVYIKTAGSGIALTVESTSGYAIQGYSTGGTGGVYGISNSGTGPALKGYNTGDEPAIIVNQAHATALMAEFQNAGTGKMAMSLEGGYLVRLINKTGANSVKGTIVKADPDVDLAYEVADADSIYPIGVVYDSGIADGSAGWVVISGIADVLLKDTVGSTRGYTCFVSDAAGRMDNVSGAPTTHDREIGHGLESKAGGTNVLTKVMLHFR